MSTTTVRVSVDRRAAVRQGINVNAEEVTVDLDVSSMSAEDRADVAERLIWDDTKKPARLQGDRDWMLRVVQPTQDGVLAALAELRERSKAAAAEEAIRAAEAQAKGKAYAEGSLTESTESSAWVGVMPDGSSTDYRYDSGCLGGMVYSWRREYVHTSCGDSATRAACKARDEQLEAETQARKTQARAEAIAALQIRYIQPRLDWIATYGSSDLQRMVAEGISSWPEVYTLEHDEWTAGIERGHLLAERPGWVVLTEDQAKQVEPPKRPRARAWMVLDQARTVEPTAQLGRYAGKYVAYATYRDQTIIWPAD